MSEKELGGFLEQFNHAPQIVNSKAVEDVNNAFKKMSDRFSGKAELSLKMFYPYNYNASMFIRAKRIDLNEEDIKFISNELKLAKSIDITETNDGNVEILIGYSGMVIFTGRDK